LTLLTAEYGEVPAELEELMLAGFGHTGLVRVFPFGEGRDLAIKVPHDRTNHAAHSLVGQTYPWIFDDYRTLVASGLAPSHPVFLAHRVDAYVLLECRGPRAGWVYDYDPLSGRPCRPIARSLSECFSGFRRMADAGVLVFDRAYGTGLSRADDDGAPVPPLETPMLFAGDVQCQRWFHPQRPRPVIAGSVADALGFEIPQAEDEPSGLSECFEPEGGWVAGRERVARLRTELGL